MWILIRLFILLLALVYRWISRAHPSKPNFNIAGRDIYHHVSYGKNKNKTGEVIKVPLKSEIIFKLAPETSADHFFKSIGFSEEFQTRDHEFDKKIYISCDHLGLLNIFANHPDLRKSVLSLLSGKIKNIVCDGKNLIFNLQLHEDLSSVGNEVVGLADLFAPLLQNVGRRWQDPFIKKMAVTSFINVIVSSIAIGAFIEYQMREQDFHLFPKDVIWAGVKLGLIFFAMVFAYIWLTFRGSSKAHRILIESFLILIISLPIAGAQLISDGNRAFDKSKSQRIVRTIQNMEMKRHRKKRGYYYTYHLHFSSNETINIGGKIISLPEQQQITHSIYSEIQNSNDKEIDLEIGPGRFNFPWYKSIYGYQNDL